MPTTWGFLVLLLPDPYGWNKQPPFGVWHPRYHACTSPGHGFGLGIRLSSPRRIALTWRRIALTSMRVASKSRRFTSMSRRITLFIYNSRMGHEHVYVHIMCNSCAQGYALPSLALGLPTPSPPCPAPFSPTLPPRMPCGLCAHPHR